MDLIISQIVLVDQIADTLTVYPEETELSVFRLWSETPAV